MINQSNALLLDLIIQEAYDAYDQEQFDGYMFQVIEKTLFGEEVFTWSLLQGLAELCIPHNNYVRASEALYEIADENSK